MKTDAAERVAHFRADLLAHDTLHVVRRHITFGSCFALDDAQHFELKAEVAKFFDIHPSEVVVVGSSKLGFSIAPQKRYRAFGEESDIDVVIVSKRHFEGLWNQVLDYIRFNGAYELEGDFRDYHFRGWVRPDKLPPASRFPLRRQWWDFFQSLAGTGKFGPYKISGALYYDFQFLERYQDTAVSACRRHEQENQ